MVSEVSSSAQKRLLHVPLPLKLNDLNFASEPFQRAAAAGQPSHVELEFDSSSQKSLWLKISLGTKRESRSGVEGVRRRGGTAKDRGHKWVGKLHYLFVVPIGQFSWVFHFHFLKQCQELLGNFL